MAFEIFRKMGSVEKSKSLNKEYKYAGGGMQLNFSVNLYETDKVESFLDLLHEAVSDITEDLEKAKHNIYD